MSRVRSRLGSSTRNLRSFHRSVGLGLLVAATLAAPSLRADGKDTDKPTATTSTRLTKLQVRVLDEPGRVMKAPDDGKSPIAASASSVPKGVTEVEVTGSAPPKFTARADGSRVLVDVSDADLDPGGIAAWTKEVGVVGGVLVQKIITTSGSSMTRISVALSKTATFRVRADGNVLRIWLTPAAEVDTTVRVTDVTFAHGDLEDRVIVKLSGPTAYESKPGTDTVVRLVLGDVKLPVELERTLDVTAYKGGVSMVTARRRPEGGVLLEVEKNIGIGADVRVDKSPEGPATLTWTFAKGSPALLTRESADGGAIKRSKTIAKEAPLLSKSEDAASSFLSSVSMDVATGRYTGRRIDLDFKDADIHNLLRLLADVGKVNIVTGDDVAGSITIKMKNVPWDQALDVILQAKYLGMVRTGNLIRVAKADALEKEREMLIAKRKQEVLLAPIETRLIPVSYATAAEMSAKAAELKSSRGSVTIDERTNVLIARDVSSSLDQMEALIRSLDTPTPEVLIEARIVEATSRYLRDVGIQWGGDLTFSSATGNPTGLSFPSRVGVAGGAADTATPTGGLSPTSDTVANPNFAVNLPAAVGAGTGGALGLTLGSINNIFNLNVRLSAAETSGMLRIVSSPRILTLDNREASISQGTLIPFSQISAQGVQTTFQEAKLALTVKPHVTADGSISMHVKINRDEPDFNQTSARGDPTILKRQAETDLLVQDGATVVIGGIYTRNTGRSVDQVPFFGSIPIIGILFQKRKASDTRSELVIFLTPRIVNRAEALGK